MYVFINNQFINASCVQTEPQKIKIFVFIELDKIDLKTMGDMAVFKVDFHFIF